MTHRLQGASLAWKCEGTDPCFEVKLTVPGFELSKARNVARGVDYGVDCSFAEDGQSLFASIWDNDGDFMVNVTRSDGAAGFCVFDLGAQIDPYVNLAEANGL